MENQVPAMHDAHSPQAIQSVSQLTASIKFMLEQGFRFISVCGEISNLRTPFSGHHYFTLKDNTAQIRAVLLKPQARYLRSPLKDGQKIICRGRISVYEVRGEYQIVVDSVEEFGPGELFQKFRALKEKLSSVLKEHNIGKSHIVNRTRTVPVHAFSGSPCTQTCTMSPFVMCTLSSQRQKVNFF